MSEDVRDYAYDNATPVPLNILAIAEHVAALARNDKRTNAELARALEISLATINNLRRNAFVIPRSDVLDKLVKHYMPDAKAIIPPAQACTFPPAGWEKHPDAEGWFYRGSEVLTEAQLRTRYDMPPAPLADAVAPETEAA